MAPRSVLFVDHETRLSGGELDLVDLVRGLVEEPGGDPLDLHVALPGDGPLADALAAQGVTIHQIPMGSGLQSVSRWELARNPATALRFTGESARTVHALSLLIARIRPVIVHSNSMKAHVLANPAAVRRRVPHIWHMRDILQPGWLRSVFNGTAGVGAARVVCISEAVAAAFTGRAKAKVRVVYNGVRPAPVTPSDVSARRSIFNAGEPNVLVVGIVGQIANWKGQDIFLEAAARLAVRDPRLRFVIVGACLFPENEADFERSLHHFVEDHQLGDRVVFTGPLEPIEPVMAALDVLVHASRLPEPFGRVIVEAMAQGTPVVSTTIGAGPELVLSEAGLLVAPGDPDALAGAIAGLVDDDQRLRRRGQAARAVASRFDIAETARGVVQVYNEVILG